jgi:hypothetical protein
VVSDSINLPDDRLLDFGLVPVGDTVGGSVLVSNTGAEPLEIAPALAPLDPPFAVVDIAGCFGATLLPGEGCSFAVEFSPSEAGAVEAGFDLRLGAFFVPIAVSGTGEAPGGVVDLGVTKTVDRNEVELPGDEIVNFTVTVRNRLVPGVPNLRTVGVLVKDKLERRFEIPEGMSAVPSRGFYNPTNGHWLVGDLAPGESATLEIPARIVTEVTTAGCLYNRATVESTTADVTEIDPSNDAARVGVAVSTADERLGGCADLAITDTGQFFSDDEVVWSIAIQNNGPGLASGPLLLDLKLPAGASFVQVDDAPTLGFGIVDGEIVSAGGLPVPPGALEAANLLPGSGGRECQLRRIGARDHVQCIGGWEEVFDCRPGIQACGVKIYARVTGNGFSGGFDAHIRSHSTLDPDSNNNRNHFVRFLPTGGTDRIDLGVELSEFQSGDEWVFVADVTNAGPFVASGAFLSFRFDSGFWLGHEAHPPCQSVFEGAFSTECLIRLDDLGAGDSQELRLRLGIPSEVEKRSLPEHGSRRTGVLPRDIITREVEANVLTVIDRHDDVDPSNDSDRLEANFVLTDCVPFVCSIEPM